MTEFTINFFREACIVGNGMSLETHINEAVLLLPVRIIDEANVRHYDCYSEEDIRTALRENNIL
jgi:hypothetical protein